MIKYILLLFTFLIAISQLSAQDSRSSDCDIDSIREKIRSCYGNINYYIVGYFDRNSNVASLFDTMKCSDEAPNIKTANSYDIKIKFLSANRYFLTEDLNIKIGGQGGFYYYGPYADSIIIKFNYNFFYLGIGKSYRMIYLHANDMRDIFF
jgi:hypothetical protein